MAFDLATAKTRLGILDTTQDALLQIGLDTAIALAENYCKRLFPYASEVAHFYYPTANTLSLPRYPVEQVASITGTKSGAAISDYKVDKSAGLIEFGRHDYYHRGPNQIDVTYAGGYKTYPADLELAFWMIFDTLWPTLSSTGGAAPTTGGAVKSISSDGARIEYDVSGGSVAGVDSDTGLPTMSINILDNYVKERA